MFIVFEWVDGCGKDTHILKTIDYLWERNKYLQIWKTREPTWNTEAGREIGERLKWKWFSNGQEALELYIKDREQQSEIRREILKHSVIISSRFDYSTYAFQWASGLSFEEIYQAHDYSKILIPDLTFIIDVNMENIEKRLAHRWWKREFFERIDFLEKVRVQYLDSAEKLAKERNIHVIDGNGSIDEVFWHIKNILDKTEF